MKKKKIALILGGVAVVVAAVIIIQGRMAALAVPENQVAVEIVKRDTIVNEVSAKGEVSLLNKELVYSSTRAEVEEVMVEKNDIVKEGEVLIRYTEKSRELIENAIRDAELNLRSAQISLSDARTPASETSIESSRLSVTQTQDEIKSLEMAMDTLNNDMNKASTKINEAEKAYSDNKALYELGAVSRESVEALEKAVTDAKDAMEAINQNIIKNELAMESAKNTLSYREKVYTETASRTSSADVRNMIAQRQITVEQAQIKLDDAKKELEDYQHEILSPIAGTVSMVSVSKGEIASTERALMEISNVEDYVVKVDVNERHSSKIALGQDVEISGAVLGKNLVYGTITKIGSIAELKQTANGSERIVPVEITVTPSEESKVLKPGFSLEAKITTEIKERIVVVPILATLKDNDGNTYIFVVKEDNTLEKRIVEIGLYADMLVEVSGVSDGEIIVSQPTIDLEDGMAVSPLNEAADAQPEGGEGQ